MTKKEKADLLTQVLQGKKSIHDLQASITTVRIILKDNHPTHRFYCERTGERWTEIEYAEHVKQPGIIHIEL